MLYNGTIFLSQFQAKYYSNYEITIQYFTFLPFYFLNLKCHKAYEQENEISPLH
jgi:hypothetical protein